MDDKTIRKRIKEYYHQSIVLSFERNKIKEIQMANEMFVGFFYKQEVNNLTTQKKKKKFNQSIYLFSSSLFVLLTVVIVTSRKRNPFSAELFRRAAPPLVFLVCVVWWPWRRWRWCTSRGVNAYYKDLIAQSELFIIFGYNLKVGFSRRCLFIDFFFSIFSLSGFLFMVLLNFAF